MKQLIYRLTEPAETIPEERKIFSNHDLKGLILPLFLEQLLEVLVGVADTFMVSYAGEAAVSGVSLVNMFNTVFIFLFSALASGGAVVVSQYIGSRNRKNGNLSAGQLVMISAVFSAPGMVGTESGRLVCTDGRRAAGADRGVRQKRDPGNQLRRSDARAGGAG